MLAGLTRLLVDPDIEPLAKKSVARQIGEWEGKRDGLRQALEGVAVQAVDDMDELMADCRRAFLEAKADFAGLMTPAQVNRFVAEVVGPLEVLPDGSVRQKETVDSEALSTVAIAGARFAINLRPFCRGFLWKSRGVPVRKPHPPRFEGSIPGMLHLVDPLLFVLVSATHDELARQVQFLRAENRMLRARLPGRVRLTEPERRRLVRLGSALGRALREIISIVKYETFRRWKRALKSRKTALKRWVGPGRPRKAKNLCDLVIRLATENRGWGYSRLVGELIKLGFNDISRTCIGDILKEHGLEPAPRRCEPTWAEFLKAHAQTLWACDYFTRPVLTLAGWRLSTVLFFMHIHTRPVIVSEPTLHPTHAWSERQALVFLESARERGFEAPTILLKDGDGKFGTGFGDVLREHGCAPKRLPVHSPNLNAYAERWVRSVRRECLDHFVAFGERHLGYLLQQYVDHYHQERPHQGLENHLLPSDPREPRARSGAPPSRADPSSSQFPRVVCRQRLGGVLKHYERAA